MKKTGGKSTLTLIILSFIIVTILCLFGATTTFVGLETSISTVFFVLTLLCVLFGIVTTFVFISYYNSLVRYKNKISESLSLIDVYLKMRFDLVPNLVAVVKEYMKHERQVLTHITKLRKQSQTAQTEQERIELSNELTSELKTFFVAVENYPDLKANKLFLTLMEDLRDIENKIAASRRFYNANINSYNNKVQTFPSSIIAKSYGFETQKLFTIELNETILAKVSLTE